MNLKTESTISNAHLLPSNIRGLGVIFDDAFSASRTRDILGIVSQDLVAFVRGNTFPQPLRMQWESDIKKHFTQLKKAEKKLIHQLQKVYQKIHERLAHTNLLAVPIIARQLKVAEDALQFRKKYGQPPFYSMALGFLNGLCSELLKLNREDLLEGLVTIDYASVQKPRILQTLCYKEAAKLNELHQHCNIDNSDVSWLPWLIFQMIKNCWTLPQKRVEQLRLDYSSQEASLKSSRRLNFGNFWSDLQKGKKDFGNPTMLTGERILSLIKSMRRQLLVYNATQNAEQPSDQIHSISLTLNGEFLCLVVKQGNEILRYLLKRLQYDSAPYKLISSLLNHPGKKFHLKDGISDSQSTANLLKRLALTGTLADIFITNTNLTATLFFKEALFSELTARHQLALKELLPQLKPYSE